MRKLTPERAQILKEVGITQVASIVKKYYNTTYYAVAKIDDIIANGGYRPKNCNYRDLPIEQGVTESSIDWTITIPWRMI